jgi:hypothetical protein
MRDWSELGILWSHALIFISILLSVSAPCPVESADIYASPVGNDDWNGTGAMPNSAGTNGPVATIERAQELVRELRAAQPGRSQPIVVALRGGRYELAATLIISDGADWTKNTPRVEFPHIRPIYSFYDQTDNVENAHFADEGHDYGPSKRAAAYRFLARHLDLDLSAVKNVGGDIDERFVTLLPLEDLWVFTDDYTRPAYGITNLDAALRLLNEAR